ncbi:EAL domain-containing protein [Pararhizobium sp. IMCC21322]|uniref:EAL domain-containing protein n=1 Tax=Pararhizobium sp. IMCC21322 TaxID=3067903 RepID=UPI002740F582|nr:EAL domain-containing protein [Pararhizobium sp. IMCC21322]
MRIPEHPAGHSDLIPLGIPGRPATPISTQFRRQDILKTITNALETTGLESQWLEIKITESLAMQKESVKTLGDLKEMGVRLAIDDFGTGHSSLSRLQTFPIDRLKIDRSFVQSLSNEPTNQSITNAIIELGHIMDLRVIAEGVETIEELDLLKQMGCDEVQGYLFSPAIPAKIFAKLLQIHTPKVDILNIAAGIQSEVA